MNEKSTTDDKMEPKYYKTKVTYKLYDAYHIQVCFYKRITCFYIFKDRFRRKIKYRYRHNRVKKNKITVLSLCGLTSVKIELISLSIGGETRERERGR